MQCAKCGKRAKIVRKFNMDGLTKEVSYCKRCFLDILKYESVAYLRSGLRTITTHMELVEEGKVDRRNFRKSVEEVYSEQPAIVQLTLFGGDGDAYEKTVAEIKERKIFILSHRLKKAVRLEKYRRASRIKKQIDDLRSSTEKNGAT